MSERTPPIGPIEAFMTADHAELDQLLAASADADVIDDALYTRFRAGLLRHIAMEEKVLLPFARDRRGGEPLEMAAQLRADHSALAKLLVRTPSREVIAALCAALAPHNALEEGPNGLYAICDGLAGDEAGAIVERLRAQPSVPLAKFYDGPLLEPLS